MVCNATFRTSWTGRPRNCPAAVRMLSSDSSIFTWATPSTITGTPWAVYTSGVVTSSVMISNGSRCTSLTKGQTILPPPTTMFIRPPPKTIKASLGPTFLYRLAAQAMKQTNMNTPTTAAMTTQLVSNCVGISGTPCKIRGLSAARH